ncbi:MAG: periplasmic heavy metal sensor [Pseudomonadota bacterium]
MSDTQAAPDPGTKPRCPLWMRLTLVASLAVNLLIAGIVGGAMLGKGDRGPGQEFRAARDLGPMPLVMALERDDRRVLGRSLRSEAQGMRLSREEMRARFEALLVALRAEPFAPDVVAGLLSEQRGLAAERQSLGQDKLLAHFASMSAGERRAYADRLEASLRRGSR